MSGALALCVALIAAQWLWRVGREARLGFTPGVAWWAVPGLMCLLLAAILDVPALFGVGAALLLLAEFWPPAYRRPRSRPDPAWPAVGAVLSLVAVVGVLRREALGAPGGGAGPQPVLLTLLLGLSVASAAGLLGALRFPKAATRPALGFQARWNRTLTPDWPELNVTLSERGAHLRNVSRTPLRLAGWSPAGMNAWYRVRDEQGRVLAELAAGQVALLPVTPFDSGVRVWYGPVEGRRGADPRGEQDAGSPPARLFRADWTPAAHAARRVLN